MAKRQDTKKRISKQSSPTDVNVEHDASVDPAAPATKASTKPEIALEEDLPDDIDVQLTEEFARQGRVIDGLKTRVEERESEINAVRDTLKQVEAERDALAQHDNDAAHQTLSTARDEALAEQVRLQEELTSTKEQLMRRAAEFQNYKRRTEQERLGLIDMGKIMVLNPVLDVLDDFERSLDAADQLEAGDQAFGNLKQGVELVYRKLTDSLERLGVEQIEAVGQPFDENWHEAMMQQSAPPGVEPGTVVAVLQEGYRLGERVIRHAKVIVAA